MKKTSFLVTFLVSLISIFFLKNISQNLVQADSNKIGDIQDDEKVTICHSTNSNSNPYTKPTVDKSSIINLPNGHHYHNGDVWFDGITAHSWGDIIPTFSYSVWEKTGSHQEVDVVGHFDCENG